jgi:hypothetical protein
MRMPGIPISQQKKIDVEADLEDLKARHPIMPRQRRSMMKSAKNASSKGNIKIAKP